MHWHRCLDLTNILMTEFSKSLTLSCCISVTLFSILPTTTDIEIPSQKLANLVHTVHTNNKNLIKAEKELLRWHYCLGHLSFQKIQHLMKTRALSHTSSMYKLHTTASKISTPPKCAACLFGKQVACLSPGKTTTVVKDRTDVLHDGNLLPGAEESVDHFISSIKGQLFTGYDKGSNNRWYVGGCIFVDHSSNYIHIKFQSSLSSHDTLRAKTSFEKVCCDYSIVPKTYMSDNGSAFTLHNFTEHLSPNLPEWEFLVTMQLLRVRVKNPNAIPSNSYPSPSLLFLYIF